ncbi:MAG: DUF2784 domain-containing protein [Burkholderiaceae bacterium]
MAHFLADAVLALHLAIAVFITAGLVLVPLGCVFAWNCVRHFRLRLSHAGLMVFVALEALLGVACPLTVIEFALRDEQAPDFFLANLMHQVLYWDAPLEFFMILYMVCGLWVLILWRWVPPHARGGNQTTAD